MKQRKAWYRKRYPNPMETEGEEKGEGSLSILVVLQEIWGIYLRKPRLGKGLCLNLEL